MLDVQLKTMNIQHINK